MDDVESSEEEEEEDEKVRHMKTLQARKEENSPCFSSFNF